MDYLVMRLYAPLSSWGTLAVGEDRPTASYPTRGAILGLIGAALGIKRTDTKQLRDLASSISIASKTYSAGTILRDYHTIQTPTATKGTTFYTRKQELQSAKIETILSSRDYREDGLWVVAIWLNSPTTDSENTVAYKYTLEQLQQALRQPVFTLYIGRKSCPLSLPLSPSIVTTDSLKDALDIDIDRLLASKSQNEADIKQQVPSNDDGDSPHTINHTVNNGYNRYSRTNDLLEQIVSDRWLPTTLVYNKAKQPKTERLTIELNEANATPKRLRQVTYHWEGDKNAMFACNDKPNNTVADTNTDTVYTHSHWDEPTNRQQWQFTQRIGHEWTTLETVTQIMTESATLLTESDTVSSPARPATFEDNTL